jgi:hypothetical protein
MTDLIEALEELEDLEFDEGTEDYEYDEARRRARGRAAARRPAPRTASGTGFFRPRPGTQSQNVTQTQLQTALAKVSADVKTNGEAIKTLNGRVNVLSSEQAQQGVALRREAAERKKEDTAIRAEVRKARELSMLQLLIQKPPTVELVRNGEAVTDVKLKQSNDSLLPILLMSGGLGGDGASGGGDNTMLLALLLSR